ncbi:hypothetical protein ACLOJK_026481 [Asimina triloba]
MALAHASIVPYNLFLDRPGPALPLPTPSAFFVDIPALRAATSRSAESAAATADATKRARRTELSTPTNIYSRSPPYTYLLAPSLVSPPSFFSLLSLLLTSIHDLGFLRLSSLSEYSYLDFWSSSVSCAFGFGFFEVGFSSSVLNWVFRYEVCGFQGVSYGSDVVVLRFCR